MATDDPLFEPTDEASPGTLGTHDTTLPRLPLEGELVFPAPRPPHPGPGWSLLWCLLFLSIIDMHLTLRGGGDLFFILLGLSANLNVPEPIPRAEPPRARAVGGVVTRPRELVAGTQPRAAS